MHELIVNLHMHTTYSDGHGTHTEIAQAAIQAGLDAIVATDHNVLVSGVEDYYKDNGRQTLLLVGEEVHDRTRQPQKNHLLILGVDRDFAPLAQDLQRLLDSVRQAGGLAFIAHPNDPALPWLGESDISWDDWGVTGYTGIELWNGMSEFKSLLKSKLHAIYYAYNPRRVARGPHPQTLKKWDELLAKGQRVAAIGSTDAHALQGRLGPLRRTVFPYQFHFQTINTHLLTPAPLSGEIEADRSVILEALGQGRSFIGYDLPAPTRGFRFTAHGFDHKAVMGEEIALQNGVTLQIRLPQAAECRLIRDGEVLQTWKGRQTHTHITTLPGAYRVEAYIHYLGRRRGWIFSNPIYVRQKA
ncbi:MAG: CehA/McbA family metallohydrolase [Anaerolineales bacterium]|nr:CehA/McbA family metallohydrolase [Anaerolineales bacterium]